MDDTTVPAELRRGSATDRTVLLVTSGPRAGTLVDLTDRTKTTLGRATECDVGVDDPGLSRRHAEIVRAGEGLALRDLGSRNGTFLNGEPVDVAAVLSPGDHVRLGAELHLRFALMQAGEVEAWVAGARAVGQLRDRITGASQRPPEGAPSGPPDEMQRVLDQARRAAQSDLPILLLGETGVGKDVLARAIHAASSRRDHAFVPVNCGALSEGLLEAELFGHERGAFTGAERARDGWIAAADGGTLFLDEVGELPRAAQVKLLRVLEDRRVTRLGASQARQIDVRFVAATHRDLPAEVERGTFRQDLLFRINAVTLHVAPLRERKSEIRALARTFASEVSTRLGRPAPHLPEETLLALEALDYPGNIRELRNLVERAVVLCEGEVVRPAEVSPVSPHPPEGARGGLEDELRSVERVRILAALRACGGNQSRAAEQLGMPRRTLVKRLGEWGLTRRRDR